MKPAILVVDDDMAVCELLQDVLSEHVFSVLVCHNGQDALRQVQQEPAIALVLLDMMLPDINGLQVLLQLQKQRPALPVIMLTGLGSESDVVVGLEMGADDYIGKPFNPRVVVARVKAVLRRTGVLAAEAPAAGIVFNGWTLDTSRCELSDPQRNTVPLTQGEYGLLLALTQNARRVLSRDRLLELTHSESADVFDRTIDVLIMRLRRKIEANPHQPALIKTIRGLGYVFASDVSRPEQAA
ncbi:response regulator transcription factor [Enterobacter cloacae complex sp. P3B]|uniref:response regulator n=2 Tax=Enterobacteriaceae TaxID=543 RepID=UPI0018665811|nr:MULTISPECIES: response regulator transcription factor [Enterobacter]MBE3180475.1 response regulator transcription factor [Enterobacter cloacae complex sp. P26RS]MBE3436099.1 response regulator transcription factor [Enterobacter cloacae complex sp. P21RS]MBE3461670.1 response regulator transcription factor [Enterobacter cloacae complex sp. P21C]MBE3497253.1 response regulator transcription factor [Enterobacter cloacae complex sp. P2B]MBE3504929.1 response regulator transcription factor [Ente